MTRHDPTACNVDFCERCHACSTGRPTDKWRWPRPCSQSGIMGVVLYLISQSAPILASTPSAPWPGPWTSLIARWLRQLTLTTRKHGRRAPRAASGSMPSEVMGRVVGNPESPPTLRRVDRRGS